MTDQSPKRPRVAMLSREDALRVLRASWPEAMTARQVYFAARPPASDLDRSVSGSAYATKAIDALIDLKLVVREPDDGSRSARYRVLNMPSANVGLEGIEAREVAHARDVPDTPALESRLGTDGVEPAVHETDGLDAVFTAMAKVIEDARQSEEGPGVTRSGSRSEPSVGDDPDPIATILLGMARAPRAGSRIDIVKNQAAEGIAWARAAGWTDHRIAQEIVEASRMDARPEAIVHLVAAVPSRGLVSGRTAQAR